MARGALIAAGVLCWTVGLLFMAIGLAKIAQMDRKHYRYDLDMYRDRKEIWRSCLSAFLWSVGIGTILVIAGNC